MLWSLSPPNRPFFFIASQPRPIRTRLSVPPPDFSRETFCPLLRLTVMVPAFLSLLVLWTCYLRPALQFMPQPYARSRVDWVPSM